MNPIPYILGFVWIALVALAMSVLSDFWLPILIGAAAVAILLAIAK